MIDWRGDEVRDKVLRCTGRAMDGLLADCVREAKGIHPPRVRTGTLQGSIQMRSARLYPGPVLIGVWGSFAVKYALALILGTKPHIIRPVRKKALYWPGADHPVKMVRHPGTRAMDFLRPVADRLYPQLPARIRREMG